MIASTPHWWVIFIPSRVASRVMCTCPQLIARIDLYRFLFDMRATPTPLSLIWTSLLAWIVTMFPYRPGIRRFRRLRIYKRTLLHVMHDSRVGLIVQCWLLVFSWHLATGGLIECVVAKGGLREHRLELVGQGDFGELLLEEWRVGVLHLWSLQTFQREGVWKGMGATGRRQGVVRVLVRLMGFMNVDHQVATVVLRYKIVWYAFPLLMNDSPWILYWRNNNRRLSAWHDSESQRSPRYMNASSPFPRLAHCLLLVDSRRSLRASLWAALLNGCKLVTATPSYNFPEAVKLNLQVFIIFIISGSTDTRSSLRSVSIRGLMVDTVYHLGGVVTTLKSTQLIVEYCRVSHMVRASVVA